MNAERGRQYQDSVFRMYFNNEARLRELAGALHRKVYSPGERLEIVTLDGTFLTQVKNDISFLLAGHYLVFLEHQSTPNDNMPLRCLYYVCEQLRKDITAKDLYEKKRIRLPAPEFHVFYTGEANAPEEYEMRLSDAYADANDNVNLELKVKFHNVVYAESKVLLHRCRALRDYARFVYLVKEELHRGVAREDAIRETIRYCIEHDIMKDFLLEHEREVVDMVNFEWNEELFRETAFEQGLEQGLEQGRVSAVLGMLKEKLPLETIARVSEMSLEKIREIGQMHHLL